MPVDSPKELRALEPAQLPEVCAELRREIIEACGRVGGHLGASLGSVELIVALHRVFRSPVDRLVFDVGHQAYAHKLLTGRRARFGTLRQPEGIAPFLDPTESEHDAFAAGHASTALSAALGLLTAKRAQGQPGDVVAIVGDGALTGGLTFEALNNAGASGLPIKLVLNDNGMSISPNVGAVERLLREDARPFFESLGFVYLGPVDGHELGALDEALSAARRCAKPVVVHARTQKGRGFEPAELDPHTRGHAMGPWELRDGKLVRSRHGLRTWSEAFAAALEARMAEDERVHVITPAMLEGSALTGLAARFPDRVHDVGIAEAHAVTFAAGLAHGGLRPVVCLYSTFLQRAFDQIVHDVALTSLPVVFAVDRAGLVGADGATHQGAFDLAILRPIPGMAIHAPVWAEDVPELLSRALSRRGPTAIRFPRGTLPAGLPTGPAGVRWLQGDGAADVQLVSLGHLTHAALEAARGTPWAVVDVGGLPLDERLIGELARAKLVVTVEEGTMHGGLGSAVLEALAPSPSRPRLRVLGLPDRFIRHGEARAQRAALGLDAEGIRRAVGELLP
ncbi:MAG: 1-deoxy-D-xylulose-5-phosphate synthase [Myxococcota bacterium]